MTTDGPLVRGHTYILNLRSRPFDSFLLPPPGEDGQQSQFSPSLRARTHRNGTEKMATPASYVQLAKSLPPPLQRFFARWPPAALVPADTKPTPYQEERPNPFAFYRHPQTGRWQDPVYSQRRQAQLVQLARDHGVEHLLPETDRGTDAKLRHRVEHGLRVKGTGVGQSVKGHIHERQMIAKYVEDMPAAHLGGETQATTHPLLNENNSFLPLISLLVLVTNCDTTGWRPGEKPCSGCLPSSGNGRR